MRTEQFARIPFGPITLRRKERNQTVEHIAGKLPGTISSHLHNMMLATVGSSGILGSQASVQVNQENSLNFLLDAGELRIEVDTARKEKESIGMRYVPLRISICNDGKPLVYWDALLPIDAGVVTIYPLQLGSIIDLK